MDGHILSGRRVKVTVNGKPYLIEVLGSLTTSPLTVNVNGQPYVVELNTAELAKPTATPAAAPQSVTRAAAAPEKASAQAGLAGPTALHIKAPMPGSIFKIRAKAGGRVKYGQHLCILEAMKMQNAVRSPRDGIIASVEVSEGQTVAHGQILFTFQA